MKKIFLVLITGLLLAGKQSQADPSDLRFRYKVGEGLQMATEDQSSQVSFQGRVQVRHTFSELESEQNTNTFAVQRGKIKIDGHVLEREIRFGFQTNFATRANAATTGNAVLEDYFVDWVSASHFGVKVGQYKVPFLMQELTSSGKQQFVDRSLATGFFNFARDIGATLHGDIWERGANYSLFVMNGEGINTLNQNQAMMVGARLELPILGTYKPSESDVDDSPDHNLGVGAAFVFNEAGAAFQNGTIAASTKANHFTFDTGYKHKGFSLQGAGMASHTLEGNTFTNYGYNAQTGYFFIPKKFETALKANGTIFANAVNQYEYALGLNYYIVGHGIKFQTDYSLLQNNRGVNLNDHRVRTQMQVVF